jgi:hypothetical protein
MNGLRTLLLLGLGLGFAAAALADTVVDASGTPMQGGRNVMAGTLASAGASAPIRVRGDFNFSLSGTFAATCELDRSFDNGTTFLPLTALGNAMNWTGPATEVLSEPEAGVLYRVNCPTLTSGTVSYRVSQ